MRTHALLRFPYNTEHEDHKQKKKKIHYFCRETTAFCTINEELLQQGLILLDASFAFIKRPGTQKMGTLANSEDQDEMSNHAAFQQVLHCLLRQKQSSEKK